MGNTTRTIPHSDTNYGVVSDNTTRTASQIGNVNGGANFGVGPTTAQTLRVSLATDAIVVVAPAGSGKVIFNELPAAPINTATLLVAYIPAVPFILRKIITSGDADAVFNLKINNVIISRKRNNWVNRNIDFEFGSQGLKILAGDTIEVFVTNLGVTTSAFEGSILGEE